MKLQAHMPTVTIGAREWRAVTIALASLFAVAMLLLGLQSSGLLNNPLFQRMRTSPIANTHINIPQRVSLDIHLLSHPINPMRRFSVAHALPMNVASSQRFSIGADARVAFEVFGDAAHRDMLTDERTVRQLKPHGDRLLMMLMLMRFGRRRD